MQIKPMEEIKTLFEGIKVAFFDMDGLLIDSEKVYNECWVAAGQALNFDLSAQRALKLRSLDSTLAKIKMTEWFHDENAYASIRAKRKEIMKSEQFNQPLQPKQGIAELIAALDKANIKAVIVTSATIERAEAYLKETGLQCYFSHIVSTENVRRGKPYPDVYQYAYSSLNLQPNECVAFEDSPNGVKSAATAGCRTIMIPDLTPYTEDLKDYVYAYFERLNDARLLSLLAK